MTGSLVIKNRPLGHYVLSVFSLLFRDKWPHEGRIYISAPSRTIGRAVDLANLICEKYAANLLRIESTNIGKIDVTHIPEESDSQKLEGETKVSKIEIALLPQHYSGSTKVKRFFKDFLDKIENAKESPQEFSICELEFILSTLFKEGYSFVFSCPNWMDIEINKKEMVKGEKVDIGKISRDSNGNIQYHPLSNPSMLKTVENCQELKSYVESALMRIGILQSEEYNKLARDMCQYDDVIVAVDTNMFYKAQVTTPLLDAFVGIARSDYLDTPNWITIVASTVSIGEIENTAARRNGKNKQSENRDTLSWRKRREACRALQEFMEIGSCVDLEGVSILLTGEIPSEFDFSSEGEQTVRDESIRYTIKNFLKNIGFYKGTYFLTLDKICEMFAKAEGLHAFYLPRESLNPEVPYKLTSMDNSKDIHNVSELVYELGVEFPLELKLVSECEKDDLNSLHFIIEVDWAEKSLENWGNRRVQLTVGFGSKRLENIKAELKGELADFKEKKKKPSDKKTKNIDKKIEEIENKIERVKRLQKEAKPLLLRLIEKLKDNGMRVGLDGLLKSWDEVNAQRHVM